MTIEQAQTSKLLYDNSKYHLYDTPRTTRLIETYIGGEYKVGEVRGWRRNLLTTVDKHFRNRDSRERGYRLYLAIKVLNELRYSKEAPKYVELMRRLTLEEVIFWVWQYNSYGNKAITALKTIHFHER